MPIHKRDEPTDKKKTTIVDQLVYFLISKINEMNIYVDNSSSKFD